MKSTLGDRHDECGIRSVQPGYLDSSGSLGDSSAHGTPQREDSVSHADVRADRAMPASGNLLVRHLSVLSQIRPREVAVASPVTGDRAGYICARLRD